MSVSPGLVNSVINLPAGQVKFFEEFKLQKNCEINLLIKTFLGLVEMMFGLVDVSFNLPEWQAVEMTFFAPWLCKVLTYGVIRSWNIYFDLERPIVLPMRFHLNGNTIRFHRDF